MPHATQMPSSGFQALILCGPGASLSTFTSNPEEYPKALIPIANRPMVWYPLDWCYRMGVTNISIVSPQSSAKAIEAALQQNPHLTSLPSPRADVLAPKDLTQTSTTVEVLRMPEVQDAVVGDFIVLPCDLVIEMPGEFFLESWMVQHSRLETPQEGFLDQNPNLADECSSQKGGLGIWFETKGEGSVKGEETDFVITTSLPPPIAPPPKKSITPRLATILYSTPRDTIKDIIEEKKFFPLRRALLKKYGRVQVHSSYRDAHVYFLPQWILEMVKRNPSMESISEDLIGLWAKSLWQERLRKKLNFDGKMWSSARRYQVKSKKKDTLDYDPAQKEPAPQSSSNIGGLGDEPNDSEEHIPPPPPPPPPPPILGYLHSSNPTGSDPLIRRVDTPALLLYVSTRLSKLPSLEEDPQASPLAHASKIAYPAGVAQRTTINKTDCLLAENVTVEAKCIIKESVVGANCVLKSGARLTRCVLMDGVVVEEQAQLTGCILGRRSQVGRKSMLVNCEVQDGNVISPETEAEGEKFMIFEGLEDDLDGGESEEEMMEDT